MEDSWESIEDDAIFDKRMQDMMHKNCYSLMKTMGHLEKHWESYKEDKTGRCSAGVCIEFEEAKDTWGSFSSHGSRFTPPRDLGTPIGVLLAGRIGY